jgi:membrane associated rhomboid family serine protease
MIPIRDDNPHYLTPYTTYAIVALNFAAWALVQDFGQSQALAQSLCTLGLVPGELLHTVAAGTQVQVGEHAFCVLTPDSNWLSLLSHMFLHGGWMHLLGNMWFLWVFGNNVEDSMGHGRFAVFYLLCGLAAAAAQMIAEPNSGLPMVGASGAIGGVMGAYVWLYPRVNVHMLLWLGIFVTTIAIPAYWMLGYWFLVQVLGGVSSLGGQGGGVAFWAHIGGFVVGALLIMFMRDPELVARHPFHGLIQSTSGAYRRVK